MYVYTSKLLNGGLYISTRLNVGRHIQCRLTYQNGQTASPMGHRCNCFTLHRRLKYVMQNTKIYS